MGQVSKKTNLYYITALPWTSHAKGLLRILSFFDLRLFPHYPQSKPLLKDPLANFSVFVLCKQEVQLFNGFSITVSRTISMATKHFTSLKKKWLCRPTPLQLFFSAYRGVSPTAHCMELRFLKSLFLRYYKYF